MIVLGAALSLLLALRIVELVYQGIPGRSRKDAIKTGWPAVVVVAILVAFYFLNWIPPVPLAQSWRGLSSGGED